jgi:epoxyqueuosine reductase QueG
LIHPDYGLWHSFRGALAFADKVSAAPCEKRRESPCERCADRPCLSACPVGAFTPGGYDVKACVTLLRSEEGRDCRDHGCLARRACPVGRERAYAAEQARFYMDAFVAKFSPGCSRPR